MKTKDWTYEELINRLPSVLVSALKNCEQDPIWHPEGNVYIHTGMVFEYAKRFNNPDLLVCAIFHDLAKPETQTIKARDKSFKGDVLSLPLAKQKISNLFHDVRAKNYIEEYFHLFSDISTNKEKVLEICDNHLRAHIYLSGEMKKPAKRNKIESLKYFKELLQFEECDTNGKSDANSVNPFDNANSKKEFLIKLSETDFFENKYNCVKGDEKKLKLKYSILGFLELYYNKKGDKNIYTILEEMNFENFYKSLISKFKLGDYDLVLSNLIFKYCQKLY